MYIARSVALGRVLDWPYTFNGRPMPTLESAALDLYVKAHGRERYERYNDKDETFHGGQLPKDPYEIKCPAFRHRPEHDVESVFWALFTALLRAQPKGAPLEQWASSAVDNAWNILRQHTIPENTEAAEAENRHRILQWIPREWQSLFSPVMRDIAVLMHKITQQVACEYALWDGQNAMHIDHLHEAVQRLILQYLVDHRDQPIPLDPEHPRPTRGPTLEERKLIMKEAHARQDKESGDSAPAADTSTANRGSHRLRPTGSASAIERVIAKAERAGQGPVVGPSTVSRHTRERGSLTIKPKLAVASTSKRKSDSQGGRDSKLRKGLTGSAVSTQDDDEAGNA